MAAQKTAKPKSWLHYVVIGLIMAAFVAIAATSNSDDLYVVQVL